MMTNYKSTSTDYNDEDAKCEKCKRLIEAAFGPEKPIPDNFATGPTIPDSEIVSFGKGIADKVSERNYNFINNSNINATTPEEGDATLVQKLEKIEETPLVDAEQKKADELNTNRTSVWFSDTDMCSRSCELRSDMNILDELAKRCINAPKDKIDSKLLEEREKIGILQPYSQELSNVPAMGDEIVQMGCPRKSRKPKKIKEIELEIRILERNTINMPRRNFLNRRAMRNLTMNLGSHDISDIQRLSERQSDEPEPAMILESNAAPRENPQQRETQSQSPITHNLELLHSTQTVTHEQEHAKTRNVENEELSELLSMNTSESFNSETIEQNNIEEIVKHLYEESIQQDSSTATKDTSEIAPAVILSRELADVNDLRITPHIPKPELFTVKNKMKESTHKSRNATVRYKHAGQTELDIGLEEIRRVFDEEKVPLHPFVDLTNSGFERTSQKTKSQDLESGLDLLKPEYSFDGNNQTDKVACQALPSTNIDIETSTTKEYTYTTLTAETSNLDGSDDLSKPLISSAIVQIKEVAKESNDLQENVKSSIKLVDQCSENKAESKPVIDKATEATDPQSADMMDQANLNSNDTEISLSELLKRVRQKSRYEGYEQVMLTTQVPELEPCAGKPPCTPLANPPPKTLPPRPCPPKPKKEKKDKKNPCAKFQKNNALDTLGLVGIVVRRVPKIEIPQRYGYPRKRLDIDRTPKVSKIMLVPDKMESLVEDAKYTNFSKRILSQRILNFIKEYEPWDSPFLLVSREQRKK